MMNCDRRTKHHRKQFLICLAAILLVLIPLTAFAGVLPERQTWAYMQSLGGISIGDPYREEGMWSLPISCDVSGSKKITVKPTLLNSALATAETEAAVEGNAIYVTIVTSMMSHNKGSLCKPAALGGLPNGDYSVFYRDPDGTRHALGSLSIRK